MTRGRLMIREVEFEDLLKRRVIDNNETSGKVTLPKHFVGRTVYVMIAQEEE
jgi:putative transposon-encoded protein